VAQPTATVRGAARRAREPRALIEAMLVAVPLALFLRAGWTHRWIADDGFIYLRVVREITSGHGPVFNSGQRVEAFTSPLWVGILSVADVLTPIRLEWLAVGLGLACSLAGIALAIGGARALARRTTSSATLLPFGILVFVVLLPAWVFQTSGLETGLTFAWEGACLAILAGWATSEARRLRAYEAAILGLGWLVRPELVLFSALFLVVVVGAQWHQDRAADRVRVVAAMVALPLAYQIFRMGYYGSLVTNTAIAKEGTEMRWGRGWDYLLDTAGPYWLWIPALALLAGGYVPLVRALERERARRASLVAGTFLLGAVLEALYVVGIGGDYIHARLLMPALFAFCAPVAVIPATRQFLAAAVVAPWAVASMLVLRPPDLGEAPRVGASTLSTEFWGRVTAVQYGWGPHGTQGRSYDAPYVYVQDKPIRRSYKRVDVPVAPAVTLPTAVLRSIGLPSFAMGPRLHVLDVYGLADPFAAHLTSTPTGRPRLPAHEKPLPSVWIAARLTPEDWRARAGAFPDTSSPLIRPSTGTAYTEQVAWARAALRCPDIRELMRAADASFSVRRFATNFVNAFHNTRLRIPPDPEKAYHRYCDERTPPEVAAVRDHTESTADDVTSSEPKATTGDLTTDDRRDAPAARVPSATTVPRVPMSDPARAPPRISARRAPL
jgi:arabinofuranosyltransferase